MIRKIKGGYRIVSHTGKNLGESKTIRGAKKRLAQVEYYKNKKK